MSAPPHPLVREPDQAPRLETVGMTKRFGSFTALDTVSLKVQPGSVHALLGENGAGKSTLVKCVMGFHKPDDGQVILNNREVSISNQRDAHALGIGMVYQHFTLVPCLTVAENLVIARPDASAIINWKIERERLTAFMERMPFSVRLDVRVSALSAGEKQKLEILKLLYLEQNFLILDEPTSVLTPAEADEILAMLRDLAHGGAVTVLMISHKFREVKAYCDDFTVLRRGRVSGAGNAQTTDIIEMSRMMIGDMPIRNRAARSDQASTEAVFELDDVSARDVEGRVAVDRISLSVGRGEILGIAGVSGNGQTALVEALNGQRPLSSGAITIRGQRFEPKRADFDRFKVFGLAEEPLRNAAVPRMSVAENIAFRTFDKPPIASFLQLISPERIREKARGLIALYRVETTSPDASIETLSGGNVQRAILARELSGDVEVLIVANPCFGLDFASVAEIRAQIMEQRNRGVAILLVSEDLDEILELADRVAVMSAGAINYTSSIAETDRNIIGRYMAGHR